MRNTIPLISTLCGTVLLSTAMASAGTASTQPANLLHQMDSAYGSLQRLDTSGTLSATFDVAGHQSHPVLHFTSEFQSPNQFRHDAGSNVLLGSTGAKVYAYQPARHVYLLDSAPAPMAPATRASADQWPAAITHILLEQNPSMLLAIAGKSGDALKDLADGMESRPNVQLADQSCPAFEFQVPGDKRDVTMVVDPSTHLLRQVRFDLKPAMEAQGATDVAQATVLIDYTHTVANGPAFGPKAFDWTPPTGAASISNTPPVAEQAGDDSAVMALVGQAAPNFSLKDLNGKTVTLSKMKGSVVVLDFWATWCGPCMGSLPHLDALYKEKKAAGLKVYAINLEESAGQVKSVVTSKGWTFPVLLDTDGKVAQNYKANAIPETIVVGKDGIVQKVFVGAGPNTEQQLKAAVETAMK